MHDFTTGVDDAIAARIIHRLIKSVRQFQKPETPEDFAELAAEWRDALNYPDKTYRPHIYEEAVTSWLATAKSNTWPPMPGDIVEHCELVMERINSDPARRPEMVDWYEARKMARIARMVGEDNA